MSEVNLPTPSLGNPGHISFSTGVKQFVDESGKDGAKLARKLQVSDAGLWVSPNGSDSNDGLSGGSAKATVQAAVTALPTGGGLVNVLNGTFTSGNIVPKTGLHLKGQGWGSILKLANGTNPVAFIGSATSLATDDVIVEDLQIDGNKANNTSGRAIYLQGKNIVVKNCYVHDTANSCIQTTTDDARKASGAGKHRILNNYCVNPGLSGNFWGSIACTGGDDIIMAHNICESTDGFATYGLDIEPNPTWVVRDVIIANNITRGGNITVGTGTATVTDVMVIGNHVDASVAAGIPHAVKIQGVTGRVLVNDNDVRGPDTSASGINFNTVTDYHCVGNRITGMGPNQHVYANNVGMLLTASTRGFIDGNFIRAENPTHATEIAGIKENSPVESPYFGINMFHNITVRGKHTREAANPDTSGATLGELETEVNELKATLRAYRMLP